jgi:hypothetical protein
VAEDIVPNVKALQQIKISAKNALVWKVLFPKAEFEPVLYPDCFKIKA